jgi:CTP:molybdopterin cytidylyltransferase MocA
VGNSSMPRAATDDSSIAPRPPVGILLAAGRAERFGGDKLLARLAPAQSGSPALAVGEAACRNLRAALPVVVAVVRVDDDQLAVDVAA